VRGEAGRGGGDGGGGVAGIRKMQPKSVEKEGSVKD